MKIIVENLLVRADTYLWAIRIFKSRTLAGEAIRGGKVKINDTNIKPSHVVKPGETYVISIGGNKKIIEVKGIIDKRVSYAEAIKHYTDHSPSVEKQEKQEKAFFRMNIITEKGCGRPTKKDRRNLGREGKWF